MIKSMTGFGRAERSNELRKISVEIKSLNSKQLDLNIRIPFIYRAYEAQIRSKVASCVMRGKVDFAISYQNIALSEAGTVNRDLFKNYYNELCGLLNEVGRSSAHEHLLAAVLKMPDVVSPQVAEVDKAEWNLLDQAIDEALATYDNFRNSEGEVLIADLLQRIDIIAEFKDQVPQFEAERIETVRARMVENLEKLKVEVDSNRLEQEIVFYIEKLDITEEKVRLQRHLDYFKEIAMQPEAGRKLGFITQEIGREINTMGSKANHAQIQRLVVGMKDELEKIKEQLLNIL